MKDLKAWERPVFFEKNRVFRVYRGGGLFRELTREDEEDGFFPEEWIASSVRAINPGREDPLEGISQIEGTGQPFDEFLREHAQACLGEKSELGVLVKYLDSAIRLPVQAHPTPEFSRKYFASSHGKAEAWLVLATRPNACVYFGFSRQVSLREFREAVDRSEREPEAMTEFVNRVPVKAGDVFFVPAGVIHAVGAGCLILEAQEPTDFTIQPERFCGEYPLSDREMYMGLPAEIALKCFDFTRFGETVVRMGKRAPRVVRQEAGVQWEVLVGPEDTPCFSMERLTLSDGGATLAKGAAVYIATEGAGVLRADGYERAIRKGEYFFLPQAAAGTCRAEGTLQLVFCAGPQEG